MDVPSVEYTIVQSLYIANRIEVDRVDGAHSFYRPTFPSMVQNLKQPGHNQGELFKNIFVVLLASWKMLQTFLLLSSSTLPSKDTPCSSEPDILREIHGKR